MNVATRPEDILIFRPEPRVEQVRFSNGYSCYIVDVALNDPEQVAILVRSELLAGIR